MPKLLKTMLLLNISLLIIGCTHHDNIEKQNLKKITIKEELQNKSISFLGDSITTFEGYSNDCQNRNTTICENKTYYKGYNHITDVNDTWWMQTANNVGLNVLVNNSYSGDKVIDKAQSRCQQLHNDTRINKMSPDIIVVYMGINDFIKKVSLEDFTNSYKKMIETIKNTYPHADIFLLNLLPNRTTLRSLEELEMFNNSIYEISQEYNAVLVDINNESGIDLNTCETHMADIKCLHPSKEGMTAMANVLTKSIEEKYLPENKINNDLNIKETNYNYLSDLLTIFILSLTIVIGALLIKVYRKITN